MRHVPVRDDHDQQHEHHVDDARTLRATERTPSTRSEQ
jgi:hypothetical protein